MSDTPATTRKGTTTARWIAGGFIAAFAASVFTVIFTGLKVERSRGEFDVGFRSVTMAPGETRSIELVFETEAEFPEATLHVLLPDMIELTGERRDSETPAALINGTNRIAVEVRARNPGSGYLEAQVTAPEAVGTYRVFVTVTEE